MRSDGHERVNLADVADPVGPVSGSAAGTVYPFGCMAQRQPRLGRMGDLGWNHSGALLLRQWFARFFENAEKIHGIQEKGSSPGL